MDSAVEIPGTRVRLGADALLGLLPGAGDAVSAGIAAYPVVVALRHRLPRALVLRLMGNIALDALAGSVPILGDLFDIGFRANIRNQRLIEHYAAQPARTARESKVVLGLIVAGMVLVIGGVLGLSIWIVSALLGALTR
jgi:hypothetical protein